MDLDNTQVDLFNPLNICTSFEFQISDPFNLFNIQIWIELDNLFNLFNLFNPFDVCLKSA